MDRIATKLWVVDENGVTPWLGNYTDYQRSIGHRAAEAEAKVEPVPVATERIPESNGDSDGDLILTAKGKPKKRTDIDSQKELAQIEREVSKLEGKLNEISDALTIATIDNDMAAIARIGEEYEKTQTLLDEVYARWEALSARTAAAV
jgi:hypothetical protein